MLGLTTSAMTLSKYAIYIENKDKKEVLFYLLHDCILIDTLGHIYGHTTKE